MMPLEKSQLPIKLDTLLLLLLVSAHMWFNPASNVLVVICVAIYIALDFIFPQESEKSKLPARYLYMIRFSIVLFITLIAAILPAGLNIIQRQATSPENFAHDGLIQTEIAIEYILEGKNPYTEDYVNTPMADFPGNEPPFTDAPLYHLAYLPFLFLGSIPFYLASNLLWGWYDQRIVYLLAFVGALLLLPPLIKNPRDKLAAIIAVGLNYLFVFYLADGRNDVVILFGLLLTTVFLSKKHITLSAIALGLTMATKHQAWLFLPFYLLYLLPSRPRFKDIKKLIYQVWPLAFFFLIIILPFLFWDASAFIDDTVTYVSGSGPDSFPMKGWGFSTLMLTLGVIPDPEGSFPFIIFQMLFGLPVFFLMLWRQWKHNTTQHMWAGFAIFAFTFQFFSRFFNDNYFIFVAQCLVIALFIFPFQYTQNEEMQDEPT